MLFRSVVLGLGLIVVTPTGMVHAQPEATTKWCAPPRQPEPLLADARRHASSAALEAQVFRTVNQLPVLGEDAVSLVVNETGASELQMSTGAGTFARCQSGH